MNSTESWWIGDLGYVMIDVWGEVGDLMFPGDSEEEIMGEFRLKDGRQFVSYRTAYGDGEYIDQFGNPYEVDSGSIGAIRLSDIQGNIPSMGHVHELSEPITAANSSYVNGVITLGEVVIDTTGPDLSDCDENGDC
jgi:hypothetical protein